MKKIIFIVLVGFIIISCSAAKDASKVLRNEKTNTTDEFLVKQKQPLELPDFNKIPLQNSKKKDTNENQKIQSILKAPKEINSTQRKSSSIEETIIDKIKNE